MPQFDTKSVTCQAPVPSQLPSSSAELGNQLGAESVNKLECRVGIRTRASNSDIDSMYATRYLMSRAPDFASRSTLQFCRLDTRSADRVNSVANLTPHWHYFAYTYRGRATYPSYKGAELVSDRQVRSGCLLSS